MRGQEEDEEVSKLYLRWIKLAGRGGGAS